MAKRLTDTDLWKKQRWFRKLHPFDKLAFCYIKDECNHAGVWKIDCSDLMEDLGLDDFNLEKFVKAVNLEYDKNSGDKTEKERLVIVGNKLWLTGFIQFQYENKEGLVNQDSAPVKTALLILQGLGVLVQGIRKGYIILAQPLVKSKLRAKDILIDKDIVVEDINIVSEKNEFSDEEKSPIRKIADGFNTFPFAKDYNGLPEIVKSTAIEWVSFTQRVTLTPGDVDIGWNIFKNKNLTGKRFYANEDEINSHFLNWIKTQNFKDGNAKHNWSVKAGGSGLSGSTVIEPDRKANTIL